MRPLVGPTQVQGSVEVCELLERWLADARRGDYSYIAVVGAQGPAQMMCEYAGAIGSEFAINYGLDVLKGRIVNGVSAREKLQGNPGADFVCYDRGKAPMCFDFAAWLVEQEMTRVREGAPAPLKVSFRTPEHADDFTYRMTDKRLMNDKAMFDHVVKPMVQFIGAIELPENSGGRVNEFYALRRVVDASLRGEEVPCLHASENAYNTVRGFIDKRPPVTITLREAKHWEHRNSNMDAWLKLAEYLKDQDQRVVFVRDTACAADPIPGFEVYPYASLNLDFRLALYEQAKANLFVSNGPWILSLFGKVPWLKFNKVSKEDPFLSNDPDWWTTYQGISEGEQFPWCDERQRIVWELDEFPIMKKAWDNLCLV